MNGSQEAGKSARLNYEKAAPGHLAELRRNALQRFRCAAASHCTAGSFFYLFFD